MNNPANNRPRNNSANGLRGGNGGQQKKSWFNYARVAASWTVDKWKALAAEYLSAGEGGTPEEQRADTVEVMNRVSELINTTFKKYGISSDEVFSTLDRMSERSAFFAKLDPLDRLDLVTQALVTQKKDDFEALYRRVERMRDGPPTNFNMKVVKEFDAMRQVPAFSKEVRQAPQLGLPNNTSNNKLVKANRNVLKKRIQAATEEYRPQLWKLANDYGLTATNLMRGGKLPERNEDLLAAMKTSAGAVLFGSAKPKNGESALNALMSNLGVSEARAKAIAHSMGIPYNGEYHVKFAKARAVRAAANEQRRKFEALQQGGLRLSNFNLNERASNLNRKWAMLNREARKKKGNYGGGAEAREWHRKIQQEREEYVHPAGYFGEENFEEVRGLGGASRAESVAGNGPQNQNLQNKRPGVKRNSQLYTVKKRGVQAEPNMSELEEGEVEQQVENLNSARNGNGLLFGKAFKGGNGGFNAPNANGLYAQNGEFRVINRIGGSMVPRGSLTTAQANDMLVHARKITDTFMIGSREVNYQFAEDATVRQVRSNLFITVQHQIFGKTRAVDKLCGVDTDAAWLKMQQRMGRIVGIRQRSGANANLARIMSSNRRTTSANTNSANATPGKPVGIVTLNLAPKDGAFKGSSNRGDIYLFNWAYSGDVNAKLGVWSGIQGMPLPLLVRFLSLADGDQVRLAHAMSRRTLCNRLPHYPVIYNIGSSKMSNGKEALMVLQEATHGTLYDWLRKPHTLSQAAVAMTQVLLALAGVHARNEQHGGLTAVSVTYLRSRAPRSKNGGAYSQYRVGNRDIFLARNGHHFLLDVLAPSSRKSTGPRSRHCEVAQVIRMFKSSLEQRGAREHYKRLMSVVRTHRPDAVMFLYNLQALNVLERLSSRGVRIGDGRLQLPVGPGYKFDVVPPEYKTYRGHPQAVCSGGSLFRRVGMALSQL